MPCAAALGRAAFPKPQQPGSARHRGHRVRRSPLPAGRGVTSNTSPPLTPTTPHAPARLPSGAPPPTRSGFSGAGVWAGRSASGRKRATSVPWSPRGRARAGSVRGIAAGGSGPGLRRSRGSAPPVPQKAPAQLRAAQTTFRLSPHCGAFRWSNQP